MLQPNKVEDTLYLTAGRLHFKKNGENEPYFYFGNTTGATLSQDITTLEHKNTDNAPISTDATIVTEAKLTLNLVIDNISADIMSLWGMGNTIEATQSSGNVSQTIEVKEGQTIILDYIDIYNLVIDGKEEGRDYTVNYKLGVISLVPTNAGGTIQDNESLDISFGYNQVDYKKIEGLTNNGIEGSLLFIGDPLAGTAKKWEFYRVKIKPDGEFNLKAIDDWGAMSFVVEIMRDTTKPNDDITSQFYSIISL